MGVCAQTIRAGKRAAKAWPTLRCRACMTDGPLAWRRLAIAPSEPEPVPPGPHATGPDAVWERIRGQPGHRLGDRFRGCILRCTALKYHPVVKARRSRLSRAPVGTIE